MTDSEFLQWINDRLVHVHGENKNFDYMWRLRNLSAKLKEKDTKLEKLQTFKDFVHRRLDEAGVSTHPNGVHSRDGCRIGDRLDIVLHAFMPPSPQPQQSPIKFQITPEGAANLYLMTRFQSVAGIEDRDTLAQLLKEYWRGGYDSAIRGEPRP